MRIDHIFPKSFFEVNHLMKKRIYLIIVSVLLTVAVFLIPILNPGADGMQNKPDDIKRTDTIVNNNKKEKDNTQTPEKINIPKSDTTVVFLVTVSGDSLYDTVQASSGQYKTVYDLLMSKEYRKYTDAVRKSQAIVKASIEKIIPDADFTGSYSYNTVINGFSLRAPYSALEKLNNISGVVSVNPVFTNYLTISEDDEAYDDYQNYDYDYGNDDNYDYDYDNDTEYNTDDYDSGYEDDNYDYTEDDYNYDPDSDEDSEDDSGEGSSESSGGEESSEGSESSESSEDLSDPAYYEMTGVKKAADAGFRGGKRSIAVIDDGFDCSAAVFSSKPVSARYNAKDIKTLADRSAVNVASGTVLSPSEKIIFAYDYAELDGEVLNPDSDHGTRTAALAAGADGEKALGIAPDSQLILMKVCKNGSDHAGDDVILAALDDAAKLSPDILNISLGSPKSSPSCKLTEKALGVISSMGTIICSSAGNDSRNINTPDENGLSAGYTDYSTISYPSSLPGVVSAASVDSSSAVYDYIVTDKGREFTFNDFISGTDEQPKSFTEEFKDQPYVFLDKYGALEDYIETDVSGKIVVVKRGEIGFTDKIRYAFLADAAGVFVISDQQLYVRFSTDFGLIPCAALHSSAMEYFKENPEGTFTVKKNGRFSSETGGKPSEFTSCGVTGDLRLKPDIAAPGTEIDIPLSDGDKDFNGTSASCAIISGASAVVSQYFDGLNTDLSESLKASVVSAMMMNCAVPAKYDDELYYSPRIQGSGMLDLGSTVKTQICVTDENDRGSVNLGDSADGKYSFKLLIRNFSKKQQKYKLEYVAQSDKLKAVNGKVYNTLVPEKLTDSVKLTFLSMGKKVSEITAAPGEYITLECSLELEPNVRFYFNKMAENGMYVDGFIFLKPQDEDSPELSVPYMGYYGSWADAEIFDSSVYQEIVEPALGKSSLNACITDGSELRSTVLGKNNFTGRTDSRTIAVGRDTVKNIYDLSGNLSCFVIPNFYLLRDAVDYTLVIKDSSGKSVYEKNIGNVSSFAGSSQEPYLTLLNSFNPDSLSNLFPELQDGEYTYVVSAGTTGADGNMGRAQTVSYKFMVDNTAPEKPQAEIFSKNGKVLLKLSGSDNYAMQGFLIYTADNSGNTLSYCDRLDALIENDYIPADSYKLVSANVSGDKAEFVYDITWLYRSLLSLSCYAKTNNVNDPEPTKIFVRSVDNAFNLSEPQLCDSVVPGKVTLTFKDQNSTPVEGVKAALDGKTQLSDKDGVVIFTDIIPQLYGLKIVSVPEDYKAEKTEYLVELTNSNYQIEMTPKIKYTGENPIITVEVSGDSSGAEDKAEKKDKPEEEKDAAAKAPVQSEKDDSTFALIFIGAMLLITTASLLLSKRHRAYAAMSAEEEAPAGDAPPEEPLDTGNPDQSEEPQHPPEPEKPDKPEEN